MLKKSRLHELVHVLLHLGVNETKSLNPYVSKQVQKHNKNDSKNQFFIFETNVLCFAYKSQQTFKDENEIFVILK